jgi:uncharacterized damage-inducible protein DinB
MTMIPYFQQLFAYDDWANRELLTSLRALKTVPPHSLRWMAHILSAERLWLERLLRQDQTQPVWPNFSLEKAAAEIAELRAQWKNYLGALQEDDFARDLVYKNTKGETWTNHKQDILMHVVMHSAYHRGQIAADIRAAGFAPPNTDFIHAVRQGHLE